MTAAVSTFKTSEPMLHELLDQVHRGEVQLPDFQRGWVWDDDHIRALLASVSLSYPIGAVMLLETGGQGVRFKPRPVEGVQLAAPVEPARLVLDGQQRLTSLYLALKSGRPVKTRTARNVDIERVYFLDVAKALDPDAERVDAFVSVPPTLKVTRDFGRETVIDLSTPDLQYAAATVPAALLFDFPGFATWRAGYQAHHGYAPERMEAWNRFEQEISFRFTQYKLPAIELLKQTPKDAVCQVFEKVNTGGVSLTVFELVTATFAADDFRLREDWDLRRTRIRAHDVLRGVDNTDFLTAVALLCRYRGRDEPGARAVSCKRADVLRLELADYTAVADAVEEGFIKAARFLARETVYESRNLPYSTQLIPLACLCVELGAAFENDTTRRKLARWYWSGVFGELYASALEARYAHDLVEVLEWVLRDAPEPRTVAEAGLQPTRLLTMQTRNSAAYKGVMALLLREGSCDFISGDRVELTTYFDEHIDIHHVFPKDHCVKQDIPQRQWNSVVNKTPLTAKSNRSIGGRAPSLYLQTIDARLSPGRTDDLIRTHLANPALLRTDDFHAFLRDRACRVLDAIERMMGKPVAGRNSQETEEAFGGPLTQVEA